MTTRKPLVAVSGVLKEIPATDFISPGAGVALPNGSASAPSAALNTQDGMYYEPVDPSGVTRNVAFSVGGAFAFGLGTTQAAFMKVGAGYQINVLSEGTAALNTRQYTSDSSPAHFNVIKVRGTIAAPAIVATNDNIGVFAFQAAAAVSG
ncbi:MAG TPA: hypothetical protein VG897_08895, partial [Terriglobales bacterium]|nr:hypothetical protein [Terriglobales bacterium]